MRSTCAHLTVLLSLVAAGAARAQTIIYVDDGAPPGGNGDTWPSAYRFLQDALTGAAGAAPPVEIRVAQGTYNPDQDADNPGGTGNRSATFQLLNGASLLGGYAGIGAPDPDLRNPSLHPAILSGDLAGDDAGFLNNVENSFHVVTGSGTDGTAVLDRFVVTAGNADDAVENSGAGMNNDPGSPLVADCTFSGNSAANIAGAMNNGPGSNPQVIGCTFTGNTAGVSGGAMFNFSNSPTITDCMFELNSAMFGGAIVNTSGGDATITTCMFLSNTVTNLGGAIENFNSSPSITGCQFVGNASQLFNGGAISNRAASNPTISGCLFQGNSATMGFAGALINYDGDALVIGCTFADNSAGAGGAMALGGTIRVEASTFEGNAADFGGAFYVGNSAPTVASCTFSLNTATFYGGAGDDVYGSTARYEHCTFAANSASGGGAMHVFESTPTLTNCTFEGNSADYGGGISIQQTGVPGLYNCLLVNNTASTLNGGGISCENGGASLVNCILRGNSAALAGGAVWSTASNPLIINSTLSGNSAPAAGGIHSSGGSSTVLANSIVWGNAGGALGGPDAASVTFSDIQGGWPGVGNMNADPLFVDAANADFRLVPSSPCVDAGDNAAAPADAPDLDGDDDTAEPVPLDLDGNGRFFNSTAVVDQGSGTGAIVDMGAYESQFVALNPEEFVAAGASNRVDTGHLDGDGDVDVVIGVPGDGKGPGSVQVFLNQGLDKSGNWQGLLPNPEISVGISPSAVAVGDLDADSHLDVAVTNAGDDSVKLLFNDGTGNGTFLPAATIPNVGGAPSDVAVAEFSGDTFPDLAVTNRDDHQVRILVNDGAGGFDFGQLVPTGGLNPLAVDPSDLDNDKDADLAGLNESGSLALHAGVPGTVFVLINDRGSFAAPATYPVGVNPTDLAIGDVDQDGFADIVAVNGADATASVLLNQGAGIFSPGPTLAVGSGPLSVEAVDLDGDLPVDLAVVADVPGLGRAVQVLVNTTAKGVVSFAEPVAFDLEAEPNYVVSADFDGNFFSDLVTANDDDNESGGSVTVLLNRPPCPADANLDGEVGILDFLLVLDEWGTCKGCHCQWDVDQDCDTDVVDFLLVLGGWGGCP